VSSLAGQSALVSGAAGDIGRAIVAQLRLAGADATGFDRVAAPGIEPADTTDPAQVDTLVARVRPRIAVINAAIVRPGPALELSLEDWRAQIEVNLTGAFILAQSAARSMVAGGQGGCIVFVGSWAAEVPDPKIPAYAAAKAGQRMLMRTLAKDLAPHGIRVNEVAPGYVDAGLSAQLFAADPALRDQCRQRVPLGHLITAEEVAVEVVALCDSARRHQTGSVVLMDGGLSL